MFACCLATAIARVEPAELVHEADLLRLPAGPDAALRDRVELSGVMCRDARHLLDELVVERLQLLAQLRPLLRRCRGATGESISA